jgi:IS30 family transposase
MAKQRNIAIVNIMDYGGYSYVLTVVDEISDEVVAALLKDKKTAETVLSAYKRIHAIITSRANSKVKTWQFDRGSEFRNKLFDEWIHEQLGAKQLFSNVEHPWEKPSRTLLPNYLYESSQHDEIRRPPYRYLGAAL